MRVLSSILPIAGMQQAAIAEATALTERWDVPNGPDVTPDLRDTEGRYFRTREGYRVAGRLLLDDMTFGSASPAAPVLIALLPILSMLMLFGQFGQLVGGLGIIAALLALSSCMRPLHLMMLMGASVLLPSVANSLPHLVGGAGMGSATGLMSMLTNPMSLAAPAALLVAVWVFSGFKVHIVRNVALGVGALLVLAFAVRLLPASLQGLFWYALAACSPLLYAWFTFRTRALRLVDQGQRANLESTGKLSSSHIEARQQQAKNAAKDMTAFLPMGEATGMFTRMYDGFAPDARLPFGFTVADTATHLSVTGSTGTGKTAAVLRPLVVAFLRARSGGMVLLDGKAALAGEFRGMRGYTLIEPGVPLGLIEGLEPTDLATALHGVSMGDTGSTKGSAKFFNDAGYDMLRHTAELLRGLIVADEQARSHDPNLPRGFFWTISDLFRLLNSVQEKNQKLIDTLDYLRHHNDLVGRDGLLDDAITYVDLVLPDMPAETRGNVVSTVTNWLTPMMSHPKILDWSKTEKGVDVLTPLRGESLGVVLPEFQFGRAGIAVQALIKQRLFKAIKARGTYDWKAKGESLVLFVIDEAQELVSPTDLSLLPVARSLGAMCVYATQNVDSYFAKFGDKAAQSFLDNFRSFISFNSSPATYEWIKHKLGVVQALVYLAQGGGIDYRFSARLQAESPLFDPQHPAASYYRSLVRRGAGAITSQSGKGSMQSHVQQERDDLNLSIDPVRGGEFKIRPLLDEAEWSAYTAEQFVAVAQVMRGGVKRRDIIKTQPMFSIPADILEGA